MRSDPSSLSREPRRSDRRRPKFSQEGLERLRAAAKANRPWEKTRGPITPLGKARSLDNLRFKQRGATSRRELQAELAGVLTLISQMAAIRSSLL
jgi:hypothetical protein